MTQDNIIPFASPNTLPPQNIEAEEAVLGGILFDPRAIERVAEILKPQHFYFSAHRKIFGIMIELFTRGEPTDMPTVSDRLADQKLIDEVGGRAKIKDLVGKVVTAVNIDHQARIVLNKAVSRQIVTVGHHISGLGYNESIDIGDRVEDAVNSAFAIKAGMQSTTEPEAIAITTYDVLEDLEKRIAIGGKQALATGLYDLDDLLDGGFYPGNLVVVGARPSMGKSVLSCKLAYEIAKNRNQPTLILSLEMPKEDVVKRYLSEASGVPLSNIRQAKLTEDQHHMLTNAAGTITHIPVLIDDAESLNINDAKSVIRKAVSQKGVCAVVVDYLQLMDFGKTQNLNNEIGDVTKQFRKLAKQLGIPIILLSQLSRGVESRADKRPMSSDLRDSGAIEAEADIILMLYRDEYYNKDTEEKGILEIICTKHRNGATGTVKTLFDGSCCQIRNMSKHP